MKNTTSRLTVTALGGDGGKTLVSLGLLAVSRAHAMSVAPFKKGPDYIDAAWLSLAAGRPTRNLDTFLMSSERIISSFNRGCSGNELAIIEGNRGLYDGVDASGTHSTAALSRLLAAPVVLVINATKSTRTLAAIALGAKMLEPQTNLCAVILNNIATARHERVAKSAIEGETGLPVVGAIRRYRGESPLPGRHLGLVTPEEHARAKEAIDRARVMVESDVDFESLLELVSPGTALEVEEEGGHSDSAPSVNVGVIRDSAFSFYYPENIESLREQGARIVELSSLTTTQLPSDLDALVIGGGFPETHADQIADNQRLLSSLKNSAEAGLPIYAECGGLMLLCRTLTWKSKCFDMAGVFPVDVVVQKKPAGHGYCVVRVDEKNPFFDVGDVLRGHEFHYSTVNQRPEVATAYAVERGNGCFDKRDGLVYKNVLASYAHLHALATPQWANGVIRQALRCRHIRSRRHRPGEADL